MRPCPPPISRPQSSCPEWPTASSGCLLQYAAKDAESGIRWNAALSWTAKSLAWNVSKGHLTEMPNWGAEGLCYSLHPRAPLVIRLSTPLAQVSLLKGEICQIGSSAGLFSGGSFPPGAAPASLPMSEFNRTVPNLSGSGLQTILDTPWHFCSAFSSIKKENG